MKFFQVQWISNNQRDFIIRWRRKINQSNIKKKNNSPLKLDKNLKSIENRILNKMKNKRENSHAQSKMPSIERNNSPTISFGKNLIFV